jgi:hypothetical protein
MNFNLVMVCNEVGYGDNIGTDGVGFVIERFPEADLLNIDEDYCFIRNGMAYPCTNDVKICLSYETAKKLSAFSNVNTVEFMVDIDTYIAAHDKVAAKGANRYYVAYQPNADKVLKAYLSK